MVESLNHIIQTINSLQEQIRLENFKYSTYIKSNQRGKAQASQVHLKNLLKKRYLLYTRLRTKLEGFALEIYYEYLPNNSNQYKRGTAHLVNIPEEEAKELLNLSFHQRGYKLRILEIKRIPTFLSKGKL